MISALSKKCLDRTLAGAISRNQSGMATGTVMLIAVLMASVALGILTLSSQSSGRDTRYALFYSMLDIININLYAFGQNDRAFKATLAYNYALTPSKMACIQNGTDCTWDVYEDIVLRYPSNAGTGATYYDPAHIAVPADLTKDGFRLNGTVCNYDDIGDPEQEKIQDNGCLLRVGVQWRPFCITNCRIGPNKITFELTYRMPKVDTNGYRIGNRNFFLPAVPENVRGPMPIYNPFR
jgi:hypothetical protein